MFQADAKILKVNRLKPVRIILSVVLGLSVFYCSSELSQMSPGPETAMALDVASDVYENSSAALNGGEASFALADISGFAVSKTEGMTEVFFDTVDDGEFTPGIVRKTPFEMFEEHRAFESPDFERPSFEIQSEKISAYSSAEKKLIARVVYAESRGEIFEGQVAVATVVLNRYESGKFGSSISKIVFASDQFAITEKYNSESLKAVERAISKLGTYPRNMYYFQVSKSRVWRNFVYYKRIGNHSFYLSGK